jgi:hypothetical protein
LHPFRTDWRLALVLAPVPVPFEFPQFLEFDLSDGKIQELAVDSPVVAVYASIIRAKCQEKPSPRRLRAGFKAGRAWVEGGRPVRGWSLVPADGNRLAGEI